MDVTALGIQTIIQRLKTQFIQTFTDTSTDWQDAMLFSPSDSGNENYGWLGSSPQMREWKDERVPAGLRDWTYTITNKRFENSLGVDVREMERMAAIFARNDGSTSPVETRIADLAMIAKMYPAYLLSDLRSNATTNLGYDGQIFISNAHVEGDSGTQDNTQSQSAATVAGVKTDVAAARAKMLKFKNDRGVVPKGRQLDLVLVCGPDMEFVAREALLLPSVSTGGPNPYFGVVRKVEVDTGITGNSLYLEDRFGGLRPWIIQEEKPVELTNTMVAGPTGQGSDQFMRGKVFFGTEWRGNAGNGDWRRVVKIG